MVAKILRRAYGPSSLVFTHLTQEEPYLVKFRADERLDSEVAGKGRHLDRVLALKSWTTRQWKFGPPEPYPPWNAAEVLDWIRTGRTSGHCGQYAMVFLQACLSMGIQARYVEVGQEANPYSHFTTEVYLTDLGKWAVMDATARPHLASHYLVDSVPQGALELHRALMNGNADDVDVVHDVSAIGGGKRRTSGTALENYYYFRVFFRQDQAVDPPVFRNPNDTADRYTDAVEWVDDETVPWEETKQKTRFPVERLTRRKTGDPGDLYWAPDIVSGEGNAC